MTLYVKEKSVMDGTSGTQVGIFPTKKQAEIFVRSMVGCEEAGIDFKACEKIANKIALLEETHIPLSDGSWALKRRNTYTGMSDEDYARASS